MTKRTGGCLCGAIRYENEAEPMLIANCYCDNCRKNSGAANSYNLAMPAGSTKITGSPKTYVDETGASGKPFNRMFCPECGTHFLSHGPAYEGIEFIKAGTLDDANGLVPTAHIWCEQKLDWITLPEGAEPIARNP